MSGMRSIAGNCTCRRRCSRGHPVIHRLTLPQKPFHRAAARVALLALVSEGGVSPPGWASTSLSQPAAPPFPE